jgi:hypothetical protein
MVSIEEKRTNLKGGYLKKQPIDTIDTKSSFYEKQRRETHTSFEMSRKAKDQTKALDIPFILMTQGDLVQEALAVAKVQTQALNIPVKVPLGGGRYADLLYVTSRMKCESLVSAFHRRKTLYRWCRLVVSLSILLSDWFFFPGF